MIEEKRLSARGKCPTCNAPLPFKKYISGRGSPFRCEVCNSELRVAKVSGASAVGAFALLSAVAGKLPFWFVLLIFSIGMMSEWLLTKVDLVQAEPNIPDA